MCPRNSKDVQIKRHLSYPERELNPDELPCGAVLTGFEMWLGIKYGKYSYWRIQSPDPLLPGF